MIELIGKIPRHIALGGQFSKEYFTRRGELRNIRTLKVWTLQDVLTEKYHFSSSEADEIQSFLMPMLEWHPDSRASARQCLNHNWLKGVDITSLASAFEVR
jgi:serine/threonine protein kinase